MNKLFNFYRSVMGLNHPNIRMAEFNAIGRPMVVALVALAAYGMADHYDLLPDKAKPSVPTPAPK